MSVRYINKQRTVLCTASVYNVREIPAEFLRDQYKSDLFILINPVKRSEELILFMHDHTLYPGKPHPRQGINIITDQKYLHNRSLQLAEDHEGNDQTVQADTLCQSYKDQGLAKDGGVL